MRAPSSASASASTVRTLTPVEHGCLCLLQCVGQRWVLYVLLVALGLALLGRGLRGLPPPARPTTLWDPAALQRTLQQFAERPPAQSERHRTEALCRSMLERMLRVRLPKVRPRWLTNPTTRRSLELDMYSEELRLAFEVDGSQHDVFSPHFHRSEDHFRYRQLLDRLKAELCQEAGVLLIRIPWHRVSVSDPVRTARCLEDLLRTHRVAFRSLLSPAVVSPAPRSATGSRTPASPATGA